MYPPYEFTNEYTGEVMTMDYRWVFVKPGDTIQQVAKERVHIEERELV